MSCAARRHRTPPGVDPLGNCSSSRYVELGGKALAAQQIWLTLLHLSSARIRPVGLTSSEYPDSLGRRHGTRYCLVAARPRGTARREGTTGRSSPRRPRFAQAGGGGVAWHVRVRALTDERRGRWPRLLAVDGHRRTLPRLREALNPLPAAVEIDAVSA